MTPDRGHGAFCVPSLVCRDAVPRRPDRAAQAGDQPPRLAAQPLARDGLGAAPAMLPARPAAPLETRRRARAGARLGRRWQGVAHRRRRRPGLTLPATTAFPPSWAVTCFTVTPCRPPFR